MAETMAEEGGDWAVSGDMAASLVRATEAWTLVLGLAGAIFVLVRWGWRAGAALAVGVLMAWMNFRWLKQGVWQLTDASVVTGSESGESSSRKPQSGGAWRRFLARYALLVGGACVILLGFHWPILALVAGLFAPVAGVLVALVVHLARSAISA